MKLMLRDPTTTPHDLTALQDMPEDSPCNSVSQAEYLLYSLIYSIGVIILLSFLERRTNPNQCGSRPSLVYPVDLLSYKTDNVGYAAAFGSMANICWNLLLSGENFSVPVWAKYLVVMVKVLFVGLMYYPLFVCLQTSWVIVGTVLGLGFSGFWFWEYFTLVSKCSASGEKTTRLLTMLPVLVCLLALMLRFLYKLVVHVCAIVRYRVTPCQLRIEEQKEERIAEECNLHYVRRLFAKSCNELAADNGDVQNPSMMNRIRDMLCSWMYQDDPAFKYSPRMVAIFTVAIICAYQLGIIVTELAYLLTELKLEEKNSNYSLLLVGVQTAIKDSYVSKLISFILSSLLTLLGIFQILTNYRQNLKKMFKGDFAGLPFKRDDRCALFILSDSLCYAGSQIAYVLYGYIITLVVTFVVCFLLKVGFILPILHIYSESQILYYTGNVISGFIVMQLFVMLQKVFCRVLLHRQPARKEDGTETTVSVVAIDNRKIYHNMAFFLFFFYIVLGLFGCLATILKSIVLGVFYLARMDKCGLIQGFEMFDKGYMYYISFLHVEECHRHPVLLVFCDILMQNVKHRDIKLQEYASKVPHTDQNDRVRIVSCESHIRAKNRWLKAYTLVRNPKLRKTDTERFDRLDEHANTSKYFSVN